jgi:hypothetical protein
VVSDCGELFEEYGGLLGRSSSINSVLLGLVLGVIYDAIEPLDDIEMINEGHPIWSYDDWVVCTGSELIFYTITEAIGDTLPDSLRTEAIEYVGGNVYSFLEHEFAALSRL